MNSAEKSASSVNARDLGGQQEQIRETLQSAQELLRHNRLKTYAQAVIRAGEELIRVKQHLSLEVRSCQALHRDHLNGEVIEEWLRSNEHYLSACELLNVYQVLEEGAPEFFDLLQKACGERRQSFDLVREKLFGLSKDVIESVLVIKDSDGNIISQEDEGTILPFVHNPDYSVILYKGIPYALNGVDRIVVRLCNESRGMVTMDMIRAECGKDRRSFNTFKMKNIFSGKNRELLGTLIRRVGHGYVLDRS